MVEKCHSFRSEDEEINDRLLLVEHVWAKLGVQLKVLDSLCHSQQLDPTLACSHFHLLEKLQATFHKASSRLEAFDTSAPQMSKVRRIIADIRRKTRYAVTKDALDELLAALEQWQQRFDLTWYLVALSARSLEGPVLNGANEQTTEVDPRHAFLTQTVALRRAINFDRSGITLTQENKSYRNLPGNQLKGVPRILLPFSAVTVIDRPTWNNLLLSESVETPSGAISQAKADVERLAQKLQEVDPDTFGLLKCYGLIKKYDIDTGVLTDIEVIYRAPPNSRIPTTLRYLLVSSRLVSLSEIVKMAKQLSRSVGYVHACDFVHKNIRPENIVVFPNDKTVLGSSFLVGFQQFRNTHSQTNLVGDPVWYRDLYRHPQRQGPFINERYVMQHDIYSLGMCLLEIGLWGSFVCYEENDTTSSPFLNLPMHFDSREWNMSADSLPSKGRFVEMARACLPQRVGNIYTDVVVDCLTCLDEENGAFGALTSSPNDIGTLTGIQYVESIVAKMAEVHV